MKTGQYYFDKMPEVFQELLMEAVKYERCEKYYFKEYINRKFYCFEGFIGGSIFWDKSELGHDFWYGVSLENID